MATRHGTHDRGVAMIQITHNGQTVYIGQRIKVRYVRRMLEAAGIEVTSIEHVLDHPLQIDGVRPITIDQAIEVLK